MRNKNKGKAVTFLTTESKWLALKVKAYQQGKTVKTLLNELIDTIIQENENDNDDSKAKV